MSTPMGPRALRSQCRLKWVHMDPCLPTLSQTRTHRSRSRIAGAPQSHRSHIAGPSQSHRSRIAAASQSHRSRIAVASQSHRRRIAVASQSHRSRMPEGGKKTMKFCQCIGISRCCSKLPFTNLFTKTAFFPPDLENNSAQF